MSRALSHSALTTLAGLLGLESQEGNSGYSTIPEIQYAIGDGPAIWRAISELEDSGLVWRVDLKASGATLTCYGVRNRLRAEQILDARPRPRRRPSMLAERMPRRLPLPSGVR
jgi:hypothetical protein